MQIRREIRKKIKITAKNQLARLYSLLSNKQAHQGKKLLEENIVKEAIFKKSQSPGDRDVGNPGQERQEPRLHIWVMKQGKSTHRAGTTGYGCGSPGPCTGAFSEQGPTCSGGFLHFSPKYFENPPRAHAVKKKKKIKTKKKTQKFFKSGGRGNPAVHPEAKPRAARGGLCEARGSVRGPAGLRGAERGCAARDARPGTHRQSLPRVLLSSALCRCGYWSASFLRAACAHTMKAFIGRLTCGLALSDPLPRTGMGTRLQS